MIFDFMMINYKPLKRSIKKLLIVLNFVFICFHTQAIDITRVEPAFWWTGMKNTELQIMVYGKDISKSKVTLSYPGVRIKEVVPVESPNYLFIYLDVSAKTKPGTMNITFTEGDQKSVHQYPLRPRATTPGAAGFTTSDVLYLITPDRFSNGNPGNDVLGTSTVNRKQPNSRHGGDLQGVENHLDYMKDLGVTTIWLNPVQENDMPGGSYHGYAITDFYQVDRRFGTNEEYRAFIEKTHQKGMKVVMDMIFNHSGSSHWWIKDLPSKDWMSSPDVYLGSNHNRWAALDMHAPKSEKDKLINGSFTRTMPDLNQRNRHLATYLIQNSIWWIEYSRIDGIRQDTHFYADYDFMARWCKEVDAEYPEFNIVGEVWYPSGTAATAWWQRNSTFNKNNSNLETVMDFNLVFRMQKALDEDFSSSDGGQSGLFTIYEILAQDFLYADINKLLVFLDNHDISRFNRKDDKDLKRYKQGLGFLLTTRGIPQIFYGTEILMTGTKQDGDGQMRKDFPGGFPGDTTNAFTPAGRTLLQNEAWNYLQTLLQWRKTSKAVTQGALQHYMPESNGVYVYARIKDEQRVLVMMNGTNADKTVPMSRFKESTGTFTAGKEVITGANIDISNSVTVPARGILILDLGK
jgi:glycosidase